jgi:vancomycin permeability regulator SanA
MRKVLIKPRSLRLVLAVLTVGGLIVLLALPPLSMRREAAGVYADVAAVPAQSVGIVFGAGLKKDGSPSDVLRDRLKTAAMLYHAGQVRSLLVSGDNRFASYSEPDVMKKTLVTELGVPAEVVYADYAGRRTYDTCVRAHDLWGVRRAVLVTQAFHLPRALWTCRRLGIEGVGASASLQPYVRDRWFAFREFLAAYQAFIDVYMWEPGYVKGTMEADLERGGGRRILGTSPR